MKVQPAAAMAALALAVAGCGSSHSDTATYQTATLKIGAPHTAAPTNTTTASTPDAVIATLRRHGLPVTGVRIYTTTTDPNHLLGRPGQYTAKVSFHDTRVHNGIAGDVKNGGGIELFQSPDDAATRMRYIQSIGRASPAFAEYDFQHGTILLRLSSDLTPAQAASYRTALNTTG